MVGVLPSLWSACKQAETGKQCVCVVYVLPTHTLLICSFILSVLYWAEHSIPTQFRVFWAFLVQENGDSSIWKGRLQKTSGALLYKGSKGRNLNIRYILVFESFLFISADSLGEIHVLPPTFSSAFMWVKHFRQSTDITSKWECRKRTLDQTFLPFLPVVLQ